LGSELLATGGMIYNVCADFVLEAPFVQRLLNNVEQTKFLVTMGFLLSYYKTHFSRFATFKIFVQSLVYFTTVYRTWIFLSYAEPLTAFDVWNVKVTRKCETGIVWWLPNCEFSSS